MDVQIRKIAWGAPKNIIAYHSTKVGGWINGIDGSNEVYWCPAPFFEQIKVIKRTRSEDPAEIPQYSV